MLNEHTLNQLRALRLDGMVAALNDAATHIAASELPFEPKTGSYPVADSATGGVGGPMTGAMRSLM